MAMETMQILLRIENTLGQYGSQLESIKEDTREIKAEAKYTNGKVRKLRTDVDDIRSDIESLYQKIDIAHTPAVVATSIKTQNNTLFSMSWEKLVFILGAVATLAAFVIEKLS